MSISLPIAEWLEGHAGKQGVAGSIPGGGIHYHFEIFANGTLFHIPAKTIQMKSSMTFIQSYGLLRDRFDIKTNMAAVYMMTDQL